MEDKTEQINNGEEILTPDEIAEVKRIIKTQFNNLGEINNETIYISEAQPSGWQCIGSGMVYNWRALGPYWQMLMKDFGTGLLNGWSFVQGTVGTGSFQLINNTGISYKYATVLINPVNSSGSFHSYSCNSGPVDGNGGVLSFNTMAITKQNGNISEQGTDYEFYVTILAYVE